MFLKEVSEKVNFEKSQLTTKHEKLPSMQRDKLMCDDVGFYFSHDICPEGREITQDEC